MNELRMLSGGVKPPCPRCGKPDDGHFHDPPTEHMSPRSIAQCSHQWVTEAMPCIMDGDSAHWHPKATNGNPDDGEYNVSPKDVFCLHCGSAPC